MAEKKQTIVIKKVYINKPGYHGGSWKVALADFMTAMMAFFLVMWLIGQNDEAKKAISDYFSTPSMIEYNYQNYGAELTLEKLFLDFVSQPLKAIQSFFEPADKTPNILDINSPKVVSAFMADKLADISQNVTVAKDVIEFDIPDIYLFEHGSAKPKSSFVSVMEKLTAVTSGLKDSEITIRSVMFNQSVPDQNPATTEKEARTRLDLIKNKVAATFEHPSNKISGLVDVRDKKGEFNPERLMGFIRISIKSKESTQAKQKTVILDRTDANYNKPVFESFAEDALSEQAVSNPENNLKKQMENINQQAKRKAASDRGNTDADGVEIQLVNPVDTELRKLNQDAEPAN